MIMSLSLKAAIRELYYWQYSKLNNFHSMLYDLIAKADNSNRAALKGGIDL
jgi:hypothetical protein